MGIKYPWMIAIVVAALVAAIVAWRLMRKATNKKVNKSAKILANTIRVEGLPEYKVAMKRYRRILVVVVALFLPILTTATLLAARFSTETTETPETYSKDIMLCLDVSGSMYESDGVLLEKFAKITSELKGERIGLTFFDSSAVSVFPLTDDYDYAQDRLKLAADAFEDSSSTESTNFIRDGVSVGGGSSMVGDGLASCVMSFDRLGEERSRSIILATDNYTYSDPVVNLIQAAQMAKSHDIRVYGLNPSDWSSESENYSYTPEEVEEYRKAVALTGGAYYKFDDAQAVPELVDQITKQEDARLEGTPITVQNDNPLILFIITAALTIGLLFLLWRLKI